MSRKQKKRRWRASLEASITTHETQLEIMIDRARKDLIVFSAGGLRPSCRVYADHLRIFDGSLARARCEWKYAGAPKAYFSLLRDLQKRAEALHTTFRQKCIPD